MSQITTYFNGSGSGTVASVTGGVGINITGNPSLNPVVNLDVPVTIAHGGTNAITMTNTFGVNYFDGTSIVTTLVGTMGQILQSNGPGMAPTFVSIAAGGVVSVSGGHDIFISGTPTNPIVNVNNAITLGDLSSIIGSPALTATTGDITITAGDIHLPITNSAGTQGVVTVGSLPFISSKGSNNTFVGSQSGNFSLTGSDNSCFGDSAGPSITSGSRNVLAGAGSAAVLTSGSDNVIIGFSSAYDANSNEGIASGTKNVMIGSFVASSIGSGPNNNIIIGYNAGIAYDASESSNIIIGNEGITSESNVIRIGFTGSLTGEQNKCFIAGITGVTTSNSQMVTIDSTTGQLGVATLPSSVTWSVITADQTAAVNNGYICNKAGLLTLTLPTTSPIGSIIEVTGINTNLGWKIAQNVGQTIYFGDQQTTTGVTGSIASTLTRDSIRIVCVVANTDWNVIPGTQGNLTVT